MEINNHFDQEEDYTDASERIVDMTIIENDTELLEGNEENEESTTIFPSEITLVRRTHELLSTTTPYVISRLSISINNLGNAIVFAYIGADAVAAGSVIATLTTSAIGFCKGPCLSTAIFSKSMHNTAEQHEIGNLILHGWLINTVYGLGAMGLFLISGKLVILLDFPTDIASEIEDYFKPFSLAVLPILWGATDQQFALSIKKPKINLITGVGYAALTMGIGYPLALGWFGLPQLGTAGIAWGASASAWAIFLGLRGFFLLKQDEFSKYKLFHISSRNSVKYLKQFFLKGSILGLQSTVDWINLLGISLILGRLGSAAANAGGPSLQLLVFYGFIIQALSQGIGVLVTPHITGAKANRNNLAIARTHTFNARQTTEAGVLTGLVSSTFLYSACILFNKPFCELLLDPNIPDYESILLEAQTWLLISGMAFFVEPMRIGFTGGLRGLTDMHYSPLLSFITMTLIGLSVGGGLTTFLDWGAGWLFLTRDVSIILAAVMIARRWLTESTIEKMVSRDRLVHPPQRSRFSFWHNSPNTSNGENRVSETNSLINDDDDNDFTPLNINQSNSASPFWKLSSCLPCSQKIESPKKMLGSNKTTSEAFVR